MRTIIGIAILAITFGVVGTPVAWAFHESFDSYQAGDSLTVVNPTDWRKGITQNFEGVRVTNAQAHSPGLSGTPIENSDPVGRSGAVHDFAIMQTDVIVSAWIWSDLIGSEGTDFRYYHIGIDTDEELWNTGVSIYEWKYSTPGWNGRWGVRDSLENVYDSGVSHGATWKQVKFVVSSTLGTAVWIDGQYIITDPAVKQFNKLMILADPFTKYEYMHAFIDDIDVSPIPEPSGLLALAGGLATVGGFAWRKRRS